MFNSQPHGAYNHVINLQDIDFIILVGPTGKYVEISVSPLSFLCYGLLVLLPYCEHHMKNCFSFILCKI